MPASINYLMSKKLEKDYQLQMNALVERPGMTRDNPEYISLAQKLDGVGRAIDEHEADNRVTDEQGKLLKPPATRTPASWQPEDQEDYQWHFEPSIEEARAALKKDPGLLQRLDPMGDYSRVASEGQSDPYVAMQDPMAPQGAGYRPTETWLDRLSSSDKLYKDYAEHAWSQRLDKARSRYQGVRRYKDIPLETENAKELISGGASKAVHDIAVPATLGAANSMTMNQAGPAYDALRDLADYRMSRMSPEELENASKFAGTTPDDIEDLPHSEEIRNRNVPAYIAGNLRGYGSKFNPTNAVQMGVSDAASYGARDAMGRVGTAMLAGGLSNATESLVGDAARYANEGEAIPVGDMAQTMAINAGLSGVAGLATGGLFDAGGQGLAGGREKFRSFERNRPLRTLEQGGGAADGLAGVVAPAEIGSAFEQARRNRMDPTKAPTTGEGNLAAELAPQLERSARTREVFNQDRIGKQMSAYYAHPDYRDIHGSAGPALQGVIDLAGEGMGRSKTTGSPVPVNAPQLKRIGTILREFADPPVPISNKVAYAEAHRTGAIVIPGEMANHFFADVLDPVGPGQSVLLQPIELNAQALTKMEERIYDELGISKTRGMNDDPVWKTVNEGIKKTRDQFPLYQDEAGDLASIPPESIRDEPFPVDPGAVPAQEEMRVLNPPEQVRGGPQRKPEGLMGVGGPQPELPGTFDRRAGKQQGAPADMLPRPIGVGGEGMVAKPEGLYGVGSGGPPIPKNPFDQRLPTSREAIGPLGQVDVQGSYGPPPPLDPKARMGVGDRFNPEPVRAFTEEGLPIPGKQTVGVQGSYNKPQRIEPDRAPTTERNPYGHVNRGQPEPEVPLPPSEPAEPRNPYGNGSKTSEESLSLLAGNKLAIDETAPPESASILRKDLSLLDVIQDASELKNNPDALAVPRPFVKGKLEDLGIKPSHTPEQVKEMSREMDATWARRFGMSIPDYHRYLEAFHSKKVRSVVEFKKKFPPRSHEAQPRENEGWKQFLERSDKAAMPERSFDEPTHDFPIDDKTYQRELGETVPTAAEEPRVPTERAPRAEAADARGGLERMLDDQLDSPDAPRVPNTEIEEIGALQTADREQVAADQKAYVDEIFSPGKAERAREVETVKKLIASKEVIDEALAIVNDVDRRLGGETGIPPEQKRSMLVGLIEKKLGRPVDVEDLIRAGLITAGLVQMATSDDENDSAAGAGIFGLGFGRGKKGNVEPEAFGPAKPKKPTQPTEKLENGQVVKGFSAMRARQHEDQTAIEKAMQRLGVEGDNTLEGRIRTYGQLKDRQKIDQALLDEANAIGKGDDLRRAAAANAYAELKDRSWGGGFKGWGNALIDFLGFRLYKGAEYPAGRYDFEHVRNPYVRAPDTAAGKIMQEHLGDPTRRLLDLTQGGPASRMGANELLDLLRPKTTPDEERKKRKSASP